MWTCAQCICLCPPGLERSPLNFLVRWDIFVVLALAAGFTWCGIYNDFTAYSWQYAKYCVLGSHVVHVVQRAIPRP